MPVAVKMSKPRTSARRWTSSRRLVFPIPACPSMASTRPEPEAAASSSTAACMSSSSRSYSRTSGLAARRGRPTGYGARFGLGRRARLRRHGGHGRGAQLARGAEAGVRLLRHGANGERRELGTRPARVRSRRRRIRQVGPELRQVVLARERHLAGKALIKDAAERVDVRTPVDPRRRSCSGAT